MPQHINLQEAAHLISGWNTLFIGGYGYNRSCMAFVRELIRQNKQQLHMFAAGPALHVDFLAAGRIINRLDSGFSGFDNIPFVSNIQRRIKEGFLKMEDYTTLAMAMRFYGGALGVPFMPIKSILGSDIEQRSFSMDIKMKLAVVECPFTREIVCLVPSVNPDFGVIHAQKVDDKGNVQIDDVLTTDVDGLKASNIKIVLTEKIVPNSEIRSSPHKTVIPGFMVDYIVEMPWGAYPTALYGHYDYDLEHMKYYAEITQTEEGFEQYKNEWILPSEREIFDKIGAKKIKQLKANKTLGY